VAAALDGTRRVECRQGENIAWLRDSRRWVRFGWTGPGGNLPDLRVQGIDAASAVECPVNGIPAPPTMAVPGARQELIIRGIARVLGETQRHRFLVAMPEIVLGSYYSLSHVCIYDMALSPGAPSSKYAVDLPPALQMQDAALSPGGKWIAWQLIGEPVPAIVSGLGVHYNRRSSPVVALWVSRTDGSEMHELGSEQVRTKNSVGGIVNGLYGLAWTPDGKRLSFARDLTRHDSCIYNELRGGCGGGRRVPECD
jgi:hypothetical protein